MTPDEYCANKAARHGSTVYYSLLSLPPDRRRALTALHAFRHETTAVVGEYREPQIAQAKIQWWREEIERLYAGHPQHPVCRALEVHLEPYRLAREHFVELIDGLQMDLDYDAYPSFAQLSLYCHRVGSAPALLAADILGYQDRRTSRFAHELGIALQLLRLLRQSGADARNGRFYFPEDELAAFGVGHADLLRPRTSERLRALFESQTTRIREYHRRAFEQLSAQDRYPQRSHIILGEIATALLEEIEADGFQLLEQRVSLTALRKLWIAWRVLRRERPARRSA
jgi:phytoene synthase